ncbi:MAG: mannitol dehydrogenase family protein [Sulfitobacter sp.]|uniref:mannitol dehydrogenase family protein n=1 Tax=Sulfitobacter sp. TaxID=1903071 RepID=UPI0032991F89
MTRPRLQRPTDPRPKTGIVHLGLGAFFRAFGAQITSDAMTASGGDWGIVGVSLRSSDLRDALRDQGWAYTAVSVGAEAETPRVIEILNDVLVAPQNPAAVLKAMADADVHIVTLTVTEKGYCHIPATGKLDRCHPDIAHDLASQLPKSAIGYIVRALAKRMRAGAPAFTVMSCDNLPQNGRLLRGLVLEFAALVDPELQHWIAENARFPCTMVDRITPATTQDDIARIAALTGCYDAAPVVHEPFAQWVIEDSFVADARPDWTAAGAELVPDVAFHEEMKLRMLNGAHSALAYTGYLAGYQTISETVADPVFERFVHGLWDEIMPTVKAPAGVDLSDYATSLFARFANPNIRHRTWQIAMDGSQKLPQRLLGTMGDAHKSGRDTPLMCLAVAAWMFYVRGVDEAGNAIDVRDPLAGELDALTAAADGPEATVTALLGMSAVFPEGLARQLKAPLTAAAKEVWAFGVRAAIERAVIAPQEAEERT